MFTRGTGQIVIRECILHCSTNHLLAIHQSSVTIEDNQRLYGIHVLLHGCNAARLSTFGDAKFQSLEADWKPTLILTSNAALRRWNLPT
jgi:hypothetical protein